VVSSTRNHPIMSWPFCPQCGTILDPPDSDYVECTTCSFKTLYTTLGVTEICTRSSAKAKPTWIDDQEDEDQEKQMKHAKISEPCPKCSHPELYFYTMQLRSVDEGQTVFYECPACQYKYSVNN
jgi:DNA-directed RNA polymerase I subunit RPA12